MLPRPTSRQHSAAAARSPPTHRYRHLLPTNTPPYTRRHHTATGTHSRHRSDFTESPHRRRLVQFPPVSQPPVHCVIMHHRSLHALLSGTPCSEPDHRRPLQLPISTGGQQHPRITLAATITTRTTPRTTDIVAPTPTIIPNHPYRPPFSVDILGRFQYQWLPTDTNPN